MVNKISVLVIYLVIVFAEAKTHAKIYFRVFFIPRVETRGYKAFFGVLCG